MCLSLNIQLPILIKETQRKHTIYPCDVHGVFSAVHQAVLQSCRHITGILTLTGVQDNDEVDQHTARGEASDFNSHRVPHLWRQRPVDLLVRGAAPWTRSYLLSESTNESWYQSTKNFFGWLKPYCLACHAHG